MFEHVSRENVKRLIEDEKSFVGIWGLRYVGRSRVKGEQEFSVLRY
jgi:hypothetical protein